MLFNQSQRDLYAVVSKNGDIVFSNIVYGSQPTPIPSFAPAPAPGAGGPATLQPAPLGAAAPEALPPPLTSGAAIESFTEPVRWFPCCVCLGVVHGASSVAMHMLCWKIP